LRLAADVAVLAFAARPPRQLEPLFLDVRADGSVDPAWRLRAGVWADAGLATGLSAHLRFVVDTEGTNNPWNRTVDLRPLGASHDLDEAYLRYRVGSASFVLGRRFLQWGPDGLLLSTGAPALDLLQGSVDLGPHRLQAFVATLTPVGESRTVLVDPEGGITLEEGFPLERNLYGHRLDLSLGSFGRLGLSELALVARRQGGFQLKYLNPVSPHVLTQIENDGGDPERVNVLHQVDGETWFGPWHLHGALLVDDLQVDGKQSRVWPDQLAWSVGADRSLAGGRAVLSYSYRRLGSWTFLHRAPGLDVEHYGRPLAAPEGPDLDRHRLGIRLQSSARWALTGGVERRRRGENRLWTMDSREGHAGEPFPRGRVERRWILEMGVRWHRPPWLQARLDLAWHAIENVNNADLDEEILEVRASIRLYGPALSWLLP
jgi:hypothetical protein